MQTVKHKIITVFALLIATSSLFVAYAPQTLALKDADKTSPDDAVNCSVLPDHICNAATEGDVQKSAIWLTLIWIINILTVGVGILAVGAIVYAGFLYATARDDAGQVKKSIEIITNTVIGLLIYVFMFAILNFLIPGGIFNAKAQTTELALIDGTERLEWRLT